MQKWEKLKTKFRVSKKFNHEINQNNTYRAAFKQ